MKLSRAAEYAIVATCHLARAKPGCRVPAYELAALGGISTKFLSTILGQLAKAGILSSLRGPDGGYRLARAPRDISILEIIEAADGRFDNIRRGSGHGPSLRFAGDQTAIFVAIAEHLRFSLRGMTVSDLVGSSFPPLDLLADVTVVVSPWPVHDGNWAIRS